MGRDRVPALIGLAIGALTASFATTSAQPTPTTDEACIACHAIAAGEWRGSAHAAAFVDPVFRAEFDPAPSAECVGCHAPIARLEGSLVPARPELGVGCTACHLDDSGAILGRTDRATPHPVRASAALVSPSACAGCHEFEFPEPTSDVGLTFAATTLQQQTVSEWRGASSWIGGADCLTCHMPRTAGGRSHAFPGPEETRLANSLRPRVVLRGSRTELVIDVVVKVRNVGHAIPTGDVFRRLVFTVEQGGERRTTELRRFFAPRLVEGRWVETEVDDTRPRPGRPASFRIRMPREASDSSVRWSLDYLRLDPEVARARGLRDEQIRIPVADGVLSPGRRGTVP